MDGWPALGRRTRNERPGETPEPDTVLLWHMADDDSLGFRFLDAGTIQFRIPADFLLREDYSAVRAEPSSS